MRKLNADTSFRFSVSTNRSALIVPRLFGHFRVEVSFSVRVRCNSNSPRRKKIVETKVVEYLKANNFL